MKLLIGDDVAFDKKISTNELIGRADGIAIAISEDTVVLTLKTPSIEYTHTINLADGKYIGLSINGNKVKLYQTKTAFTYE